MWNSSFLVITIRNYFSRLNLDCMVYHPTLKDKIMQERVNKVECVEYNNQMFNTLWCKSYQVFSHSLGFFKILFAEFSSKSGVDLGHDWSGVLHQPVQYNAIKLQPHLLINQTTAVVKLISLNFTMSIITITRGVWRSQPCQTFRLSSSSLLPAPP